MMRCTTAVSLQPSRLRSRGPRTTAEADTNLYPEDHGKTMLVYADIREFLTYASYAF